MSVALQWLAMSASRLVDIGDARRTVLAAVSPLSPERVELGPGMLGRVLAEKIAAESAVPAFDSSAMDGFAVRASDLAGASASRPVELRVIDESRAGAPATRRLSAGEAIAISTGAVLPGGADAIVRVEDTRRRSDRVEMRASPAPGQDIRLEGEDVRRGELVLSSGTALGPAELGVLASLARSVVLCAPRPRVAVLVSGDELLGPGEPMRPGGVRDSSSFSIAALTRCAGGEVSHTAIVRDDADATREAIARALEGTDVTVVCGGVSVGDHDHVRGALRTLGATQMFWGLALKPGRPAWFGTVGRQLVFGLPGNPVSAMVTFVLLVRPALRALLGSADSERWPTAVFDSDYAKAPGRAHAVRCRLSAREDGWHVQPTGAQGSHILTSMLGADALAIIPRDAAGVRAGERVEIEPLWRWTGAPA
jgi:molybdopterin molybdotransferase